MRVLIVHGRYRSGAPSGENIVVDQEGEALRSAGHEVLTFERHSDDIAGWSLLRKASLPVLPVWNSEVGHALAGQVAAARPDVVHVHNTFPLLSPSVLHACRALGVPVVATIHNSRLLCAKGDFFRDGEPCHACSSGRGWPAVRHRCYRGSRLATLPTVTSNAVHRSAWQHLVSAYVFVSAAHRDMMEGLGLPTERVFVKPNFVEWSTPPPPARRFVVTFVGRLDEAKGISLLMRSWDCFRAQHPRSDLRLAVVGGGPMERQVREWATRHPTVEVVGLVDRTEAATRLGESVASVVTSECEETFGLVAVESMAAGVAPIVPTRGAFPELVTDRVDGVLYTAGDQYSLSGALAEVEARPERLLEMGREAQRTYDRRFRRAANVEQLVAIYRYAIRNPAWSHASTRATHGD
jgi:glycosyltransferase involved in cell wall biosynthesis